MEFAPISDHILGTLPVIHEEKKCMEQSSYHRSSIKLLDILVENSSIHLVVSALALLDLKREYNLIHKCLDEKKFEQIVASATRTFKLIFKLSRREMD